MPYVQTRMEHTFGKHTTVTLQMNLRPEVVQAKSLARIQRELCEAAIEELQALARLHAASEQEEAQAPAAGGLQPST